MLKVGGNCIVVMLKWVLYNDSIVVAKILAATWFSSCSIDQLVNFPRYHRLLLSILGIFYTQAES